MTTEEKKLTDKEKAFCYNYVCNPVTRWNGKRSAIESGYSENTATVIAYENLIKPHIKSEIEHLITTYRESHKALEEKIISERTKLAFSDLKDYIDPETLEIKNLTDIDTSCIKKIHTKTLRKIGDDKGFIEIDVKFELHDKTRNLDSLANYLGMDKNDLNLNLESNIPVEINFISSANKKD